MFIERIPISKISQSIKRERCNASSEIMQKCQKYFPKGRVENAFRNSLVYWKAILLMHQKCMRWETMKTSMIRDPYRHAVIPRGGKWKKIWRILKVSRKWKGTRRVVARTTYRIESMLSSFVPWLFHNRLWYNSTCSCIPYVYALATPTSGRVNTISRYALVAVSRMKNILCYLLTGHTRNTWVRYRFALHFKVEILEFTHFRDLSRDKSTTYC